MEEDFTFKKLARLLGYCVPYLIILKECSIDTITFWKGVVYGTILAICIQLIDYSNNKDKKQY